MSKLRACRELTRRDKKARKVLKEGILKWWPDLRFMTFTGVTNFRKQFRQLKLWLGTTLKEYFAVRTAEGGGVIHLVAVGKGVRWGELSASWRKISGSWNVSISKVKNVNGVVEEMTRQHKVIRYFHSQGWLGRKAVQVDFNCNFKPEIYRETKMKFIKTVS